MTASDLKERLRAATMGFDWADLPDNAAIPAIPLLREAADQIKSLEARIARLSEALEPFAKEAVKYEPEEADDDEQMWAYHQFTVGDLRRASIALAADGGGR